MQILTILEQQEVLQNTTTAEKIARQLVNTARRNAPQDGYGIEILAKKLAARYYKDILSSIELELKTQKAHRI